MQLKNTNKLLKNLKPSFAFCEVSCFVNEKESSVAGLFYNNYFNWINEEEKQANRILVHQ